MNTKTIYTTDYLIEDVDIEGSKLQNVLCASLKKRFISETNHNTYDYAIDVLNEYVYVPPERTLWVGRYARYIDMKNPFTMSLKLGGHVVKDNGYTVTLLNNRKHIFLVSKRSKLWFMLPNYNDINRIKLNKYI
jgi:hypothetical protein